MFRGDIGKVIVIPAPFLVVGESLDVDLREPLECSAPDWRSKLTSGGVSRGPLAIDWFFFNRGLFADVPPFSIGRARFDNWLVWRARSRGAAVIDGTAVIEAFHIKALWWEGAVVGRRWIRALVHRDDLDMFVYVKDVRDRLFAGETNYDILRPDVWKQSHPEAIRI